jgi:Carboxypeptidase regulatory-like domain/TonB-dependent Receptor Plug Domain
MRTDIILKTTAALLLALVAPGSGRADVVAQASPTVPSAKRDSVATATIAGVVVDSSGKPVGSASVQVTGGSPHTTTDTLGQFRLVGVPAGEARVQVTRDGFAPLGFAFAIAANVTVSLKLTLLPAPPVAGSAVAPGSASVPVETAAVTTGPPDTARVPVGRTGIAGKVVDTAGKAIFGATISAISTNNGTQSDSAGRFRITNLEPGLIFVRVRKIGYLSEYFPLQTEANRTATLTVKLRPSSSAPSLARVEVRADSRRDARMVGFYERMRLGNGVFVEREELLRRNTSNISEVLRGRNGVNIIRDANNNAIVFGRNLTGAGYCAMGVLIDGVFVSTTGMSIDQLANTQDVRAIEVYKTGPSVPSEFQRRETDCGAVLIWTR